MVNRLTLTLEQPEYSALLKIAIAELRNPPDQVRYLLRQELERRGLLSTDQHKCGDQIAIKGGCDGRN